MNDHAMRQALLRHLARQHGGACVVEEPAIDDRRIDVLVVGATLDGYEIKSDDDTLTRLEGQASTFGRFCQHLTLVTTPKYMAKAQAMVPDWWGLLLVEEGRRGPRVVQVRRWRPNPDHDHRPVLDELWAPELKAALSLAGEQNVGRCNLAHLRELAKGRFTYQEAMAVALLAFKGRRGWGSKPTSVSRGGPLRAVVEVLDKKRQAHGAGGYYSERVERLECGHEARTRFDFFKKMEAARRRCASCKDGPTHKPEGTP